MKAGNCPHNWAYKELVTDTTAPGNYKSYKAHDGCRLQIHPPFDASGKPIRIYTPKASNTDGTDG